MNKQYSIPLAFSSANSNDMKFIDENNFSYLTRIEDINTPAIRRNFF